MKAYIIRDCMDKSRTFHKAGTAPELDKSVDGKLWTLKLVEDYNEKKHGEAVETSVAQLEEANKALGEANQTIEDLEAEVVMLKADQTALGEANEKVAQLEEANKALGEGDIGQLKKEISTLKGKNTKLANEIESLKAE